VNLFKLTLYADFLNGAMLPVIFYFLIKFSENPEIMASNTHPKVLPNIFAPPLLL